MKQHYKKNEAIPTMASEPAASYCASSHPKDEQSALPEGCMTLDQFAEIFHQKLNNCYAKLSDCSK